MKYLGILVGAVAVFLLGRLSKDQDISETDFKAVNRDSVVALKAKDSRRQSAHRNGSLSARDPNGEAESYEEELGRMMEISNWPQRRDLFAKYMEEFTPDQGPTFVAAILDSNESGASNHNEWRNLFFRWGEVDPESALAFLENADTTEWKIRAKSDAVFRVYLGWSEKDSPAAYRTAEKTGYIDSDRTILGALISNWAQQDTDAVTEHIVEEARSDLYGYLGAITEIIARRDGSVGLMEWQRAAILKNPQLQGLIGGAVAGHMGSKPPEAVAAWLVSDTKGQDGVVPSNIARQAYRAMQSSYPQRTPELLVELSKHDSANLALKSLVTEEVERSPSRLRAWLEEREGDSSVAALRGIFSNVLEAVVRESQN